MAIAAAYLLPILLLPCLRDQDPGRTEFVLAWNDEGGSPACAVLWNGRVVSPEDPLDPSAPWPLLHSVLDERDAGRHGVRLEVPGQAPATLLLHVLSELGASGRRIADVQLRLTGGAAEEILHLNQRGAWGAEPEVIALAIPAGFTVAEALAAAKASAAVLDGATLAFRLPWRGAEPDPVAFLDRLDVELHAACSAFFVPWYADAANFEGGVHSPDPEHPDYAALLQHLRSLLEPHAAPELPRLDLATAAEQAFQFGMMFAFPKGGLAPGDGWLVSDRAETAAGTIVRAVHFCHLRFLGGTVCWLRFDGEHWRFCSWPADPSWHSRSIPLAERASPYIPDANALRASLQLTEEGASLSLGYSEPFEFRPDADWRVLWASWMEQNYEKAVARQWINMPHLPRSIAIEFRADPGAPQAALAPLLAILAREDCLYSTLRLQVSLDTLDRPGVLIFDQSATRPGGDLAGATLLRLQPDHDVQQLCDRVDRLLADGVTRLTLLPPE